MLTLSFSLAAQSVQQPLPEIDIRMDNLKSQRIADNVQSRQLKAGEDLKAVFPGLAVDWNLFTGNPKMVRSVEQFLTEPSAETPTRIALDYVRSKSEIFSLSNPDLDDLRITRDAVTKKTGRRRLIFQQQLKGIDLLGGEMQFNLTSKGEIINCGSDFIPSLADAVNKTKPKIKANQALQIAAGTIEVRIPDVLPIVSGPEGTAQTTVFEGGGDFSEDPRIQLNYWAINRSDVRLVWRVTLGAQNSPFLYQVLVDATDGTLLQRTSLTNSEVAPGPKWRVFTSDSPAPFSPGPGRPLGTQAPFVTRELVETNGDPAASPAGWIPAAGTTTTGNNADAFIDTNGDGTPEAPRPTSATQNFDFPLDLTLPPSDPDNQRSAVVNAFYWANLYHDRLYNLGFDEAAGNFQTNNFGLGGLGGDAISIRVQSGFDNSFFATPADGSPGIWWAFTFSGPNPDRDAALDQEIAIHELTHGLSNRLAGGLSGLQAQGMGEGWSDFYALALLSQPGDDVNGTYAMGGYSMLNWVAEAPGWADNYYFGIRRYPYSTNMGQSPMTYADIDPAQFAADPLIPTANWLVGGAPNAVHQIGEIWCAALWECRANLINFYGFNIGNDLILQLVTDGLGLLTTNSPTLIQARDAILLADMVNNGGANQCLLWKGFAKRGLGPDATSPASFTTSGVVESFYTPVDVPTAAITAPTCPGSCDASVTLTVTGGYGTISYLWNTGQTTKDITGVCAGTYTIFITDDLGCMESRTFVVPEAVDHIPPVIVCPADIIVACDINPNTTGLATATDNCDPAPGITFTDATVNGDCEWLCLINRTWTATDTWNNQSSCTQQIQKNTLPLIEEALSKDVNGDGNPDPLVLGATSTTLTIGVESAACILKWMPADGGAIRGLKRGNQTVTADCKPGNNPVNPDGSLANPLMAEVLKLSLILRLDPDYGTTKLADLDCAFAPIVLQTVSATADIDELMRVANFALGNLVLVPHLTELTDGLACINATVDICAAKAGISR